MWVPSVLQGEGAACPPPPPPPPGKLLLRPQLYGPQSGCSARCCGPGSLCAPVPRGLCVSLCQSAFIPCTPISMGTETSVRAFSYVAPTHECAYFQAHASTCMCTRACTACISVRLTVGGRAVHACESLQAWVCACESRCVSVCVCEIEGTGRSLRAVCVWGGVGLWGL